MVPYVYYKALFWNISDHVIRITVCAFLCSCSCFFELAANDCCEFLMFNVCVDAQASSFLVLA